jgi:hypothetical protein
VSGPKHTPGPWRVKGDDSFGYFVAAPSFHGDAYDSVILGDDEYREESRERNKADAQLAAAAPRLAEALKACTDELERQLNVRYLPGMRETNEVYELRWQQGMALVDDARAALREAGVEVLARVEGEGGERS